MTLPVSGPISLSATNVELQQPPTATISLGSSTVRQLAQVPSGPISMSNLYGKTWLTAPDASAWYATYRDNAHQWGMGGSGDTRAIGGPYQRYTSSSSYTATFSNTGITSTWTTIVLTVVEGGSYNIRDISINGGAYSAASQVTTFNADQQVQVVLYVNTDVKNITSVYFVWDHSSGNFGSWPSASVIPGKWTATAYASAGSPSIVVPAYGIAIGTNEAGGDGPWYGLSSVPAGSNYHNFTAWWYNCCQHYMVVNPTGTSSTSSTNYADETYHFSVFAFEQG